MNNKKYLSLIFILISLISCSNNKEKSYEIIESYNENLKLEYINFNTKSLQNPNILVIPIEFKDSNFTNKELDEIKILCNGTSEETSYWESLKSFYYKSSYGQLDLNFTFLDPYNVNYTVEDFYTTYKSNGSSVALEGAISSYINLNGDGSTEKFDENNDGYIDTVIMIYSCDQYSGGDTTGELYWAYRYWDYLSGSLPSPNLNNPVGNSYFWASLNFFYKATGTRESHTGIDAHVLIHEFGHLLGADDYYNTASNEATNPSGGKIMMANNVLDHDAFNKFNFGWMKPILVKDSCEITISSSAKENSCILLADDDGWNKTSFDEYVLIEYFTPTYLNELDSKTNYFTKSNSSSTYSKSGVRVWHVDNRLCYVKGYSGEACVSNEYISDQDILNNTINENYIALAPAARNSNEGDATFIKGNGYDSLTLVSPTGNKFVNSYSSDDDLFEIGDKFSLNDKTLRKTYSPFFSDSYKLNNGNSLNFEFEITNIKDDTATIKFTKI